MRLQFYPLIELEGFQNKSDIEPTIDPKELIEKATVAIIGVKGEDEPGSGVIVKKEGNVYSVLTAAHVICNRQDRFIDTEEYAVKTFDGFWHDSYNDSINGALPSPAPTVF